MKKQTGKINASGTESLPPSRHFTTEDKSVMHNQDTSDILSGQECSIRLGV